MVQRVPSFLVSEQLDGMRAYRPGFGWEHIHLIGNYHCAPQSGRSLDNLRPLPVGETGVCLMQKMHVGLSGSRRGSLDSLDTREDPWMESVNVLSADSLSAGSKGSRPLKDGSWFLPVSDSSCA